MWSLIFALLMIVVFCKVLKFKMKTYKKGKKYVLKSHICDKASKRIERNLKEQVKLIARPQNHKTVAEEVETFNSMVMGIQNYYSIATNISLDSMDSTDNIKRGKTNRIEICFGSKCEDTYMEKCSSNDYAAL